MKKFLLFLGVFFYSAFYAQSASEGKKPVYLIDGAVASENVLKEISQQDIESVNVYKNAENLPAELKGYSENAVTGIINIHLKSASENNFFTVEHLNTKFGLPADSPVHFNGTLLNNPQTKILKQSIKDLHLIETDGTKQLEVIVY